MSKKGDGLEGRMRREVEARIFFLHCLSVPKSQWEGKKQKIKRLKIVREREREKKRGREGGRENMITGR